MNRLRNFNTQLTKDIKSPEVRRAFKLAAPPDALESTVITHGLPRPQNLGLARGMETEVRKTGATPATIALLNGEIRIGLSDHELELPAPLENPLKVSQRDFATVLIKKPAAGQPRWLRNHLKIGERFANYARNDIQS